MDATSRRSPSSSPRSKSNAGSGRARFFETGDEVQVAWRGDAGHFVLDR
jgi:hypothetical protein